MIRHAPSVRQPVEYRADPAAVDPHRVHLEFLLPLSVQSRLRREWAWSEDATGQVTTSGPEVLSPLGFLRRHLPSAARRLRRPEREAAREAAAHGLMVQPGLEWLRAEILRAVGLRSWRLFTTRAAS